MLDLTEFSVGLFQLFGSENLALERVEVLVNDVGDFLAPGSRHFYCFLLFHVLQITIKCRVHKYQIVVKG